MLPLKVFITFFILNSLCFVMISTQQGNKCNITETGEDGVCTLLDNCPKSVEDLTKGITPQTCGFQGTMAIVCCTDLTVLQKMVETSATSTTVARGINKQKCTEYGRSVWVLERPPILLPGAKWNNVSLCGHKVIPLIVGGEKAGAKEFPHMALVGYSNGSAISWECGGTLISERFVLTAAHCVQNRKLQEAIRVRLGDLNINLKTDDAQPEEFTVIERIKHPDYLALQRYHDIALLKLDRIVKFNAYIRPACLQNNATLSNRKAVATGWGSLEFAGRSSSDLMKVTLDMFDQNVCNNTYKLNISNRTLTSGIIPAIQICAGGLTASRDTCQGDSGGPLQIYNTDVYCMYTVIGVTSFGKACGVVNSPGVYTRVSNYISWIENIVWPNN